jgi:hypothetical protein
MIKITVTRDSVCAGDDFNPPHEKRYRFQDDELLKSVLQTLQAKYLPNNVSGGKATWTADLIKPFAVLAQQWKEPELIVDPELTIYEFIKSDMTRIHFSYLAQESPEAVLANMKINPAGK